MMKGWGQIYGDSCEELCTVMEKGGSDKAVQIFVGVKSWGGWVSTKELLRLFEEGGLSKPAP